MSDVAILNEMSEPELPNKDGFPFDWYWRRQDGTLFSSDRIAIVTDDDKTFGKWSDGGRIASVYPRDEDHNDSEAELQTVLDAYNLSASLPHYIRKRTWELRVTGTTIAGVRVTGDSDTMGLLRGLKDRAQKDPTGTFSFDDGSETGGELTAEQAIGLYDAGTDWVQSTFDKRVELLRSYAEGDAISKADVDKALAPPKARASAVKKSAK